MKSLGFSSFRRFAKSEERLRVVPIYRSDIIVYTKNTAGKIRILL